MFCNCSITSAKKVHPTTGVVSSFYQGAVGGKGGAVQKTGSGDDAEFIATYYDNEKSFRDGVIGLVTSYLGSVAGSAIEAGQAAKTARHAATTAQQTAAAKSAAEAAKAAATADLIKAIPPEGGLIVAPIKFP